MSNPLSPLSSSYQNARAQSQMANSSPFLHKTADQVEISNTSSPLKREWTSHNAPNPNAYDENENYYPNEPDNENLHENDDINDAESYQGGASSPFQYEGREDTANFQNLRQMQQTSHSYPQLEPLDEESPASSPFRPNAAEDTVGFQRLREVDPMSPGLDKRLALEEPMSSPFRPHAAEDTMDLHNMQDEPQSSPLARPQLHSLQEESPQSSPFRPHAREESGDFQKLREVQPMSPGLGKRLTLNDPESSPFRPDARDETVDFDRLREMQNQSPIHEAQLASSPFRHQARKAPFESPEPLEMQEDSLVAPKQSSPAVVPSSSLRPEAPEEGDYPEQDDVQPELLKAPEYSSPVPAHSSFRSSTKVSDNFDSPKPREKQQTPPAESHYSSPVPEPVSTFQPSPKEHNLDIQKTRRISRVSLGLNAQRPVATTPRKRSYDQTPQDQEDDLQVHTSHKKGMMSRPEAPAIHIDAEEESSVVHDQSMLSALSAAQDRSAIGHSMMEDRRNEGMSTVVHEDGDKENVSRESNENSMVDDSIDDTCLSTFSAVPDMTTFAKLRAQSPMKSTRNSIAPRPAVDGNRRGAEPTTPGTGRRAHRASAYLEGNSPAGSPTPRPRGPRDMVNPVDSANLLDFSDSMNFHPRQSMQSNRFSPSRRSPMRSARQSIRSPGKMSSLLDFDIPPAPTPRSIPTVTPRELESLKSGFMSEISSLKATLSGKEAEVASLKQAVTDAERRVGEALEEVRNEAAGREVLEMEQAEWVRRGKEMEADLLSLRTEMVDGERERDRLSWRAEEAEKGKERLKGKIVELESQLSAARAAASSTSNAAASHSSSHSAENTAREVQDAVEKVARELHTLYKGKHETKVAALKKSYETRWEKRLRESEKKLAAVREENEHLRLERDAAHSDSMAGGNTTLFARENEQHEAEKRVMEAQITGMQKEMASLKEDTERIRSELESERAEKGELVAAVDEWLAMQQPPAAPQREREASVASSMHDHVEDPRPSREATPDGFRHSVTRSGSGNIRPPATAEKRIPRFGAPGHSRGNSGGKSGIAMPTPGRGIMGSIERMGRGGV